MIDAPLAQARLGDEGVRRPEVPRGHLVGRDAWLTLSHGGERSPPTPFVELGPRPGPATYGDTQFPRRPSVGVGCCSGRNTSTLAN